MFIIFPTVTSIYEKNLKFKSFVNLAPAGGATVY